MRQGGVDLSVQSQDVGDAAEAVDGDYTGEDLVIAFNPSYLIDGVEAVVFGSENGDLYVVNAETGANLPGWPEPVTLSGGEPTAIESSPTVAYLDGPSNPPT